jgi:hypothetical protein
MAESDDFEDTLRPGGTVPAKDFALIYHTTPGRVCQMLRRGELPGRKINGRWFVHLSARGRDDIETAKKYPPVEEAAGDEESVGAPTLLETCVNLVNYWRAMVKEGRVRWKRGKKDVDAFIAEGLFQDADEAIKMAQETASAPPAAQSTP